MVLSNKAKVPHSEGFLPLLPVVGDFRLGGGPSRLGGARPGELRKAVEAISIVFSFTVCVNT